MNLIKFDESQLPFETISMLRSKFRIKNENKYGIGIAQMIIHFNW